MPTRVGRNASRKQTKNFRTRRRSETSLRRKDDSKIAALVIKTNALAAVNEKLARVKAAVSASAVETANPKNAVEKTKAKSIVEKTNSKKKYIDPLSSEEEYSEYSDKFSCTSRFASDSR